MNNVLHSKMAITSVRCNENRFGFLVCSRDMQRLLYEERKSTSSFSLLILETGSLEEDIKSESSNVRWILPEGENGVNVCET